MKSAYNCTIAYWFRKADQVFYANIEPRHLIDLGRRNRLFKNDDYKDIDHLKLFKLPYYMVRPTVFYWIYSNSKSVSEIGSSLYPYSKKELSWDDLDEEEKARIEGENEKVKYWQTFEDEEEEWEDYDYLEAAESGFELIDYLIDFKEVYLYLDESGFKVLNNNLLSCLYNLKGMILAQKTRSIVWKPGKDYERFEIRFAPSTRKFLRYIMRLMVAHILSTIMGICYENHSTVPVDDDPEDVLKTSFPDSVHEIYKKHKSLMEFIYWAHWYEDFALFHDGYYNYRFDFERIESVTPSFEKCIEKLIKDFSEVYENGELSYAYAYRLFKGDE